MNLIEKQIRNNGKEVLNKHLIDIKLHSSGAYSNVYKAKDDKTNIEIIIKVFYKNGFVLNEIRELEELRKYSIVQVPEIYGYSLGDDNKSDMFFMELMPGIPVRYMEFKNESKREKIANEVVDAHISIHNIKNPNGFGSLDCDTYSNSWESTYKSRIDSYYNYINNIQNNQLTEKARNYIDEAYYNFDKVFQQPVRESSLLHGDFKMKNILIDPNTYKLTAILDPMGCGYGDRESDLFPYINHPEDVKFKLLDNYNSKVQLSDNFPLKNQYYFLWNEVKLYVFMGYCMNEAYEKIGDEIHNMLRYGF